MTRELLQKAYVALRGEWWADDMCRQIDKALAAPQPEPDDYQMLVGGVRWTHCAKHIYDACIKEGVGTVRALYAEAPPAAPSPAVPDETPAEEVLRSLASYLGAGGYNAPTADAKVFRDKIMWGIDNAIKSAVAQSAAPAVREPQDERAAFEAWVGESSAPAFRRMDAWGAWQARAHDIGGGGNHG